MVAGTNGHTNILTMPVPVSVQFLVLPPKSYCILVSETNTETFAPLHKNSTPPPQHMYMCFKNWNSTSTAVEAAIIAAGFRQSEAKHGAGYVKVVGNGD